MFKLFMENFFYSMFVIFETLAGFVMYSINLESNLQLLQILVARLIYRSHYYMLGWAFKCMIVIFNISTGFVMYSINFSVKLYKI